MTALQVRFPQEWATLPTGEEGLQEVARLVDGLAELGPEAQRANAAFLEALVPALGDLGIGTFATLAVPDSYGGVVQALCTVSVLPAGGDLRTVAEGGPHPGLDRETTTVELPVGTAVRSSAVRAADELVDDDGWVPYVLEVRFALPLPEGRGAVLHFETPAIAYQAEMEQLFDAIAGTAQLG